jgi:hypothetical protein
VGAAQYFVVYGLALLLGVVWLRGFWKYHRAEKGWWFGRKRRRKPRWPFV